MKEVEVWQLLKTLIFSRHRATLDYVDKRKRGRGWIKACPSRVTCETDHSKDKSPGRTMGENREGRWLAGRGLYHIGQKIRARALRHTGTYPNTKIRQ